MSRLVFGFFLAWIAGGERALAAAGEDDWRLRARAGAAEAWRLDPANAARIATIGPVVTRNGALRFTARELRSPSAAPLLIERLLGGAGTSAERAALAAALPLTRGDWAEAVAEMLATEADPGVRAQLAGALEQAPSPDDSADAALGLKRAAADPDAAVRAAAMRAIGGRADGAALGSVVVRGFADPDASVRAFAARAAGYLGLAEAWGPVSGLLVDDVAEVRLRAVAALERLDPAAAASLPALAALRTDADVRVARAATRVVDR